MASPNTTTQAFRSSLPSTEHAFLLLCPGFTFCHEPLPSSALTCPRFTSLATPVGAVDTPRSGETRRLKAFLVPLNQGCEPGGKRWYDSTLELQLASKAFCETFRSVPTLRVSVNYQTPRSLRCPRSDDENDVPIVRARGLTWALPTEDLVRAAAIEQWKCLKVLQLDGPLSAASLEAMVWPHGLERLTLGDHFNQPVAGVTWPVSLKHLAFGYYFNQCIVGTAWPASLELLWFGWNFNQSIDGVEWPSSL